MRLRTLLLALLFITLVLPLPTHGDNSDCSAAAPIRLTVGSRARVSAPNGLPLHANPGEGYRNMGNLKENAVVAIVGGPTCADGAQWWQVRSSDGRNGWLTETDATGYRLEPWPVNADIVQPLGSTVKTAR